MMTFCEAIARKEGWLVPTSRCRRNHNPGNIEAGHWANDHGAIGTDGRFAIFPDDQAGFNAMSELLIGAYAGMRADAAITRWAPPLGRDGKFENNTALYISNVCDWTGLLPASRLTLSLLAPPRLS